jgi:hypothetical protein
LRVTAIDLVSDLIKSGEEEDQRERKQGTQHHKMLVTTRKSQFN